MSLRNVEQSDADRAQCCERHFARVPASKCGLQTSAGTLVASADVDSPTDAWGGPCFTHRVPVSKVLRHVRAQRFARQAA